MNLNLQHTNWAFTPRYNKVNTKCYSKQYIEIKVKYKKGTKFLSWINAKRPFRNCAQEIILLILTTFCFDYLVILLGENWLWSLLGLNAKTFVWLSGTGRSLHVVRTCKPLTWLVCGTSTFLIIRKKKDCLQITVELKFILKVINANLIQLHHSMVISFVFESSIFTIRFKPKTRVKTWLKTSNTRLFFSFELKLTFWTLQDLFGLDNQI